MRGFALPARGHAQFRVLATLLSASGVTSWATVRPQTPPIADFDYNIKNLKAMIDNTP